MKRTLSIIKPDAIKRSLEGKILNIFQEYGFKIIALKKMKFTNEIASEFYSEHKEKSFFNELCRIITSGPIVCSILEKENAIIDYRTMIGSTNPKEAAFGTIRNIYGISIDENTVHGSDSNENALREMKLIFHSTEIF